MATKTTAKSGVWSATDTWVGGTLPADGDTIVIDAQHTLTLDVDLTAAPYSWTTGAAGVTITGHSTTAGKLTCSTSAGTYVLPIKTGTSISGTSSVTYRGQIYAGSSGTPLPNTVKFQLKFLGTATLQFGWLDIQLFCTEPTYKYVKLNGAEAAGQTALSVDTDVTGDIWANGDRLVVVDVNGRDAERATFSSATASEITISSGLANAKIVGAHIVRVTRNIELIFEATGWCIDSTVTAPATVHNFGCAIIQNSGTLNGYGLGCRGGVNFTGIVEGMTYGIINTGFQGTTHSGIIVRCENGWNDPGFNNRISSTGMILGCGIGVNTADTMVIEGTIRGCTTGLYRSPGFLLTGTIDGCTTGITGSSGRIKGGKIGYPYANATVDVDLETGNLIEGYGSGLLSSTKVSNYLGSGNSLQSSHQYTGVRIYDELDAAAAIQAGYYRAWTPGGTLITEAYSEPTHGTPPITLALIHKFAFGYASFPTWFEVPFWATEDIALTVVVYMKKDTNSMTETPWAKIVDPNVAYNGGSEALDSETMSDDTNWQTLTLAYTPTHSRPLALRVGGAHGSGTLYWNFVISAFMSNARRKLLT